MYLIIDKEFASDDEEEYYDDEEYHEDDKNNEVTLNSPIGKALHRQKIGSTVSYKVNNKELKVNIIRKVI